MTFAAKFVLKALKRLSIGRLTMRLPDGTIRHFGAAGAEPQARLLQHRQPLGPARQVGGRDAPLHRQLLGQVGEGKERDPIGPQISHQIERGRKPLRGLLGQAADQIHIHAGETSLPQPAHHPPQLLHRHHTVHGFLHVGVCVLNAEADAVEAQLAQLQHRITAEELGIDLDRGLQIRLQIELRCDQLPELGGFLPVEVVGSAAPPVQLGQPSAAAAWRRPPAPARGPVRPGRGPPPSSPAGW